MYVPPQDLMAQHLYWRQFECRKSPVYYKMSIMLAFVHGTILVLSFSLFRNRACESISQILIKHKNKCKWQVVGTVLKARTLSTTIWRAYFVRVSTCTVVQYTCCMYVLGSEASYYFRCFGWKFYSRPCVHAFTGRLKLTTCMHSSHLYKNLAMHHLCHLTNLWFS